MSIIDVHIHSSFLLHMPAQNAIIGKKLDNLLVIVRLPVEATSDLMQDLIRAYGWTTKSRMIAVSSTQTTRSGRGSCAYKRNEARLHVCLWKLGTSSIRISVQPCHFVASSHRRKSIEPHRSGGMWGKWGMDDGMNAGVKSERCISSRR